MDSKHVKVNDNTTKKAQKSPKKELKDNHVINELTGKQVNTESAAFQRLVKLDILYPDGSIHNKAAAKQYLKKKAQAKFLKTAGDLFKALDDEDESNEVVRGLHLHLAALVFDSKQNK